MKMNMYATIENGTIERAPVIKSGQSQNGYAWKLANFSIKVTETNNKTDKPIYKWVSCVAWGEKADYIAENISVGSIVKAVGVPGARAYINKSDEPKAVLELTIINIDVLVNKQQDMLSNETDGFEDKDLPF